MSAVRKAFTKEVIVSARSRWLRQFEGSGRREGGRRALTQGGRLCLVYACVWEPVSIPWYIAAVSLSTALRCDCIRSSFRTPSDGHGRRHSLQLPPQSLNEHTMNELAVRSFYTEDGRYSWNVVSSCIARSLLVMVIAFSRLGARSGLLVGHTAGGRPGRRLALDLYRRASSQGLLSSRNPRTA
jgi:hypothetical protein